MEKKSVKTEGKAIASKAVKTTSKPAAKKSSAKAAAKTTVSAAKTTSKTVKKTVSKTAAKKPAAKKPKVVSVEEMCGKLEKLINKTKASAVKTNVAVDVKVWGWDDNQDRHLYIEIKDGVLSVAPHEYNASSFEAYISYENILKFLNGKLTLKDAIAVGALNANGNIPAALIIGSIF